MYKEEILSHFNKVKKTGNGYMCLCPAHDDHNPSCSITFNGEWANVHCFVGCSKEDILRNAGLTRGDLYMGEKQNYQKRDEQSVWLTPTEYVYQDEEGKVLYTKYVQYEKEVSHKETKPQKKCWYKTASGKKTLTDVKRVPYQLPLFKDADTIFIVEGEKCAKAVTDHGYVATTLDCGAGSKWNKEYLQYFEGKEVIILPDNDEPGMKYAKMFKEHIPWAVIKVLTDLEKAEDVYDWLQKGHSMEEIKHIEEYVETPKEKKEIVKKNQSEELLELVEKENVKSFLNDSNDPFVAVFIEGHREILSMDSKEFSLWLQMLYYKNTGKTIRGDNLTQTLNILNFKTRVQSGEKICLYNRIAKHEDSFWYDMTNADFSAIKISIGGWSVEKIPPILFHRYRHQMEQVIPHGGGDINKIFEYVHLPKYRTLFLCWLVSCFVPNIPHPMPIFYGEKGATKSTTCELLKRIIDPSAMDTLSLGKDEKNLLVSLQSHYYLPFDNVSTITNEVSDILCRAITGGAVQYRKFYTNADDYIFKFKRCLTINGISNVANRSDLIDRSIMLELERVPEEMRREQQEVYASFERDRPYILGAIFDVLSKAMEIYPTVSLKSLPRMADFCRWGYAIAEAINGGGKEFLKEYRDNQSIQNDEAVNADVVAYLIVELMRNKAEWSGRVSELLKAICDEAPKHGMSERHNGIPQYPNKLSIRIKGVKSNLAGLGISYEFDDKKSDGTHIILRNKNVSPLPPYVFDTAKINEKSNGDNGGNGDGGDDFDSVNF